MHKIRGTIQPRRQRVGTKHVHPLRHGLLIIGLQAKQFVPFFAKAGSASNHNDKVEPFLSASRGYAVQLDRSEEEPLACVVNFTDEYISADRVVTGIVSKD
jgi:hypothetical protein